MIVKQTQHKGETYISLIDILNVIESRADNYRAAVQPEPESVIRQMLQEYKQQFGVKE